MVKTKALSVKEKVWVIIPVYNEEKTVANIIEKVSRYVAHILVIDDHSTDSTPEILSQLPIEKVRNNKNLGYTQSLTKGFQYAFSHGAQYVISFDADGEHKSQDLKKFIRIIHKHHSELIVGNRSRKNRFVEIILGWITGKLYGISDPFCGFKSYQKDFFLSLGNKLETRYSIAAENIFKAVSSRNVRLLQVDLDTGKREDASRFASKIKGNLLELRAAFNILRAVISKNAEYVSK